MSDRPKATVSTQTFPSDRPAAADPDAPAIDKPLPVTTTPPHDERDTAAMPDAPRAMVRLVLPTAEGGTPFSGELQIGNSRYVVTAGVVIVPPWHADDARAAGYIG